MKIIFSFLLLILLIPINLSAILSNGPFSTSSNISSNLPYDLSLDSVSARTSSGFSLFDDGSNLGLFVKDGGNVGFGTVTPDSKVHIYQEALTFESTGSNSYKWLSIQNAGGSERFRAEYDNTNSTLKFRSDSVDNIILLDRATGYVGLGTPTPDSKLDIQYTEGVAIESFRGTTDTDITGWILYNADGEACYVYPNATQDGIIVSSSQP